MLQPWMTQRNNETVQEWQRRINHTCYLCGTWFPTLQGCDAHEQKCVRGRKKGTHKESK